MSMSVTHAASLQVVSALMDTPSPHTATLQGFFFFSIFTWSPLGEIKFVFLTKNVTTPQ